MKLLLSVLIAFLFCQALLAQSSSPAPTVAQLVGTWKLVSVEDTANGKTQPAARYGLHPVGFLMYEADGYMCATLGEGDRPAWKNPAQATDAEKIAYYDTLVAYCGTYKLDPAKSMVTHYPTIAWMPAYVGSAQPRPFRLEGDKLIITVTEGISDLGIEKRVLVWQRAKATAQ